MAWSIIREAGDADYEALNKSARRFMARHPEVGKFVKQSIEIKKELGEKNISLWSEVDRAVLAITENDDWSTSNGKRLAILWKRCIRRALDAPTATGIAYGYVGHEQE